MTAIKIEGESFLKIKSSLDLAKQAKEAYEKAHKAAWEIILAETATPNITGESWNLSTKYEANGLYFLEKEKSILEEILPSIKDALESLKNDALTETTPNVTRH